MHKTRKINVAYRSSKRWIGLDCAVFYHSIYMREARALYTVVLRRIQHSIGYMGDGFYRSKDPTNSIEVLKDKSYKGKHRKRREHNTHRNKR